MRLVVNGASHDVDIPPSTPLIYALRNDLGLPGARYGCGQSQCGACYVLVDGVVVASCETPVESVAGRDVTTVDTVVSPLFDRLRAAFVAEQAAQCGYCLSGMLVSAAALLAREPRPDDASVRLALDGNLCRCGTHNRIVRAVVRAGRDGQAK